MEHLPTCVHLFATHAQAQQARKRVASRDGKPATFGAAYTTPLNFFSDEWEVWGDGRTLVDGLTRKIALSRCLQDAPGLPDTPGTVSAFASLIATSAGDPALQRSLADWEALQPGCNAQEDAGSLMDPATRNAILSLLHSYLVLLDESSLIEPGMVPGSLERADAPVGAGRIFIQEVAATGPVTFATMLDELGCAAAEPHNHVPPRLVEPAGPRAQAEQLCDLVERLIDAKPTASILLVDPDPLAVFQLAAHRLVEAGAAVECRGRMPLFETAVGRACKSLIALMDGEPGWRDAAVDFALSPLSGVGPDDALRLDAHLRGHRGLEPDAAVSFLSERSDAFTPLCALLGHADQADGDPGETRQAASPESMDATERLLRGLAVRRLARSPLLQADLNALDALVQARRRGDVLGLDVRRTCALLADASVPFACSMPPRERQAATITVAGPAFAGSCLPASYDVVLFSSCTDDAYPVSDKGSSLLTFLEDVGATPPQPKSQTARQRMFDLAAAARDALVLFVPKHDAAGNEAFPAFFVRELREERLAASNDPSADARAFDACVDAVPSSDEGDLLANILQSEPEDLIVAAAPVRGRLDALALPELIPNITDGEGSQPVLSPSALERFAGCPYRWFIQSIVRPQAPDQGFGLLEQGLFVHEVMRVFHDLLATLRANAKETEQPVGDEQVDRLFDQAFDQVLARQTPLEGVYVAVDPAEKIQVERLRERLRWNLSLQQLLPGEYEVAGHEIELPQDDRVRFAGARLAGRIDRVDVKRGEDGSTAFAVIDYKGSIAGRSAGWDGEELPQELPSAFQALIYAQALRAVHPAWHPVAAVYLDYNAQTVGKLLAGSFVPGAYPAGDACTDTSQIEGSFTAYLDAMEQAAHRLVQALMAGSTAPKPRDAKACLGCPVPGCSRRL